MKRRLLTFLLMVLAVRLSATQGAPTPADAIIARVNGDPVMLSELKDTALDQDIPLNALLSDGMQGEGFRRALTQLVDEKLLVQQARQADIVPREQDISKQVEQMIQGLRKRMGSDEKMNDFLRAHYMTLDSLRRVLTERERRRDMSTELVARRVQIDEGKLDAFSAERRSKGEMLYEVSISQILVLCSPEQRRTLEGREIYLRALQIAREAGARPDEFDKLAQQKSDDPTGRVRGGYLGWIDSSSLQPEIWNNIKSLKPGDISDPIVTDQGYHIIRLMSMNGPRDLLFQQEFEKERIALIEELRAKAMIQFYDFEGKPIKDGGPSRLETPVAGSGTESHPDAAAKPVSQPAPSPSPADPTGIPAFSPAQPGNM